MMAPVPGLIIPIWLPPNSVNQRLPSTASNVIPAGALLAVGMVNSVMACVVGLIIPILLAVFSVNQRLPSTGSLVITSGPLLAVGVVNSLTACVVGLIIPIRSFGSDSKPSSVNQRLLSGPVVIPEG